MVSKSRNGNTVLTTVPWISTDFLLENRALWSSVFPDSAASATMPQTYLKLVAHGVPSMPETQLSDEILAFNSLDLQPSFQPRWLTVLKPAQKAASAVFAVSKLEDWSRILRNGLFIAGTKVRCEKWKPTARKVST